MANVSMDLVKKLREKTQVGMMDCKKALEESNGDIEKAIEILRKKGSAVAAKRGDNATTNGRVECFISSDAKTGAMVEVACETDFSAKTVDMEFFAKHTAEVAAITAVNDAQAILSQKSVKNPTLVIKDHLDELIAKIAESIKVSKVILFKAGKLGMVHAYIHPGSTVGVMIELEMEKDPSSQFEALKDIAKDLCMQIAVNKPLSVSSADLDPASVAKEREIATEQLKLSGKPANVIEKILEGKIKKYYEDVCLLNQFFIKNDKLTIQLYLDEVSKKLGNKVAVKQFVRIGIGR
ncbi:MAG: translation elongation factor Ts [Candidatus Babeliales bacterium]|jgi:elongation factor Ts